MCLLLKKMKLVETFSVGAYKITSKGREVLQKYGEKLTLENLRELPEFIATQINVENIDVVYVKSHKRGNKVIGPYICNKNLLKNKNPNIERSVTESFRESLTNKKASE